MLTPFGRSRSLVFGSNAGGSTGSLKALLTKITGINSKHGPFSCVICLGDMFPVDEDDTDADVGALIDGSLAVPVSTYCMLGSRALPKRIAAKAEASNGEICENLFFLGEYLTYLASSGQYARCFSCPPLYYTVDDSSKDDCGECYFGTFVNVLLHLI